MANDDNADGAKTKSKKGLIIAIIVVVNVLAIGAAFFLLGGKGDEEGQKNGARQNRGGRNAPADGPIIELDGFVVNLAAAREKKYLKTKMSVHLYTLEDQPEFEKYLSVVRNEILLQLSAVEVESVMTIEGKRELEKMLVQKVNERLDMDRIANIYLTEFVTQ